MAGQNVSNPSVPGTGVLACSNESVTFGGFLLAESLKILELRPLAAPFYLPPLDLMRGAAGVGRVRSERPCKQNSLANATSREFCERTPYTIIKRHGQNTGRINTAPSHASEYAGMQWNRLEAKTVAGRRGLIECHTAAHHRMNKLARIKLGTAMMEPPARSTALVTAQIFLVSGCVIFYQKYHVHPKLSKKIRC